jgi:hypothetical protein
VCVCVCVCVCVRERERERERERDSADRTDKGCVLQDAAEKLGLGITTLKKICRSGGIPRWPFRKRHSVVRLVKDLEFQKSKMQDLLMRGSLEEDLHGTNVGLPSFVLGGDLQVPLVSQGPHRAGPVVGLPSTLDTPLSQAEHLQ